MSLSAGNRLGFKGWLCISGLLIFLAGTSLGFLAAARLASESKREEPDAEPAPPGPEIVHVTDGDIYQKFRLAEAQRAQVDRILADHYQKIKSIRKERDELGRKVEADLLALHDEAQREGMRQILRQINFNGVAERVSGKVSFYKRELKLSDPQEYKCYSILLADQLDKDDCARSCDPRTPEGRRLSRDEVRERFARLNEERARKLRPILDDTQWARFRELEARKKPKLPAGPP